jgi:hypothetical protein
MKHVKICVVKICKNTRLLAYAQLSRIGSMEVSIDKEYKDALTVNSLRSEKNKK